MLRGNMDDPSAEPPQSTPFSEPRPVPTQGPAAQQSRTDTALDDEDSWLGLYGHHRPAEDPVPGAVVGAMLEDVQEAGVLHSVALLEIARKWGFSTRP